MMKLKNPWKNVRNFPWYCIDNPARKNTFLSLLFYFTKQLGDHSCPLPGASTSSRKRKVLNFTSSQQKMKWKNCLHRVKPGWKINVLVAGIELTCWFKIHFLDTPEHISLYSVTLLEIYYKLIRLKRPRYKVSVFFITEPWAVFLSW